MTVDARSLQENYTIETDVCIVGAGTAGLTLAREFVDKGFRVCLLESGGLKPDQETQSLYWGENVGHPYFSLDTARARYFGGTTNRWHIAIGDNRVGARMRPLDEIDFEERDWVPHSGWPFSKSDIDPFYDRAQVMCRIEPLTYDVADWEDPEKSPRLPLDSNHVGTVIYKFGSSDPFITDYAKDVIEAANITTLLYANVIEIETNETAQAVKRLRVACLGGKKFWVSAKLYVLAAGAIEIPRLLLLSNKSHRAGLGNQHHLVGKFFMEHPHFWLGLFVPSMPDIFKRTGLYNSIHTVNGVPIVGKLSLSEQMIRRERLLNYVGQLEPMVMLPAAFYRELHPSTGPDGMRFLRVLFSTLGQAYRLEDLPKRLVNVISDLADNALTLSLKIKTNMLRMYRKRIRLFRLVTMSEQAPNPLSRISLSSDRDCLGQNRVNLDWQLSPMDLHSAARTEKILGQEFRRAGLGKLYTQLNDRTPAQRITGGWHHMGTTRMHVDPKKGVVDKNSRVHGIANLFIAGPSVFPTSGCANPALTIVALTIRLADHIKKLMAS